MKICYVVTIPLTIKSFFVSQINYLNKHGFDITVICSDSDMLVDKLDKEVKLISVAIPRGISIKGSIFSICELYRIFKKEKFDLVQYSTPNAALYSALAAGLCRVKIRNYHLMGLRYLGSNGLARAILKLIEKTACRLSTHIECVSRLNMELGIKEKLFSPQKVTVVWNGSTGGIDLRRFDIKQASLWREQVRNELHLEQNDFVFGFVGRITADKGINEILGAFGDIKNAKLLMIGRIEGVETINQDLYKQSLCDENIIYVSEVSDIERYYAALDVLLLPSYREGFGNVVIEAAALGVPAIVSDIPGPTDTVLKDKTATIIPVKDVEALKRAMQYYLNNPDTVEQLSDNCVDFVSKTFDSDKLNEKILERKCNLLNVTLEKR